MKTEKVILFVILLSLLAIHSAKSDWQQTALISGSVNTLSANNTSIFAGTLGLYVTTSGGSSWSNTNVGSYTIKACVNGNFVLALATSQFANLYRSTDNGVTWSLPINMSAADGTKTIECNNNRVYVGTVHYGIRRSTDNGATWIALTSITNTIYSIAANANFVFAGKENFGVYRSTNYGDNWSVTTLPPQRVNSIEIIGNKVYAGTQDSGIYISSDNGINWIQSSLINQRILCIESFGNNVFAGTNTDGLYCSSNNGASWIPKNEGLTNLSVSSLLVNGDYLYAGTNGSGVWKRNLNELVGVNKISTEVPIQYNISQNFPNPFNPSTKIVFSILQNSNVSIKVYNILGMELEEMVNQELNAGKYSVVFDGSNLPSGIYLYRITAEGNNMKFSKSMKMTLIK